MNKMKSRNRIQQKLFPAMGTLNSITLSGDEDPAVLRHAASEVARFHDLWNVFDPESELSAVNAAAGRNPVRVSPETFRILQQAVHYAELSGGAFDITAGALSSVWKTAIRAGRLPDPEIIRRRRRKIGSEKIRLDPVRQTVFLTEEGMKIDLGGIAKGYAADWLCNYFLSCGVRNARINLGGTIRLLGEGRMIGIRNPFREGNTSVGKLMAADEAIVTSGIYEQCALIGGRPAHHIIDPRTGYPADSGLVSVTLIGPFAAELDALATGILILGANHGAELLKKENISAILITDHGKILVTQDLKNKFTIHADCIA